MIMAGWYLNDVTAVLRATAYYINKCSVPLVYNISTGECGNDEQKGAPPPESCIGNPINFAIGNKYQLDVDYRSNNSEVPGFSRYYNSLDGLWRHSYSSHLRIAVGALSLVHADGRESFFKVDGGVVTGSPTETGLLVKRENGWIYTYDDNQRLIFDAAGRLIETFDAFGGRQRLSYAGGEIIVTGENGQSITFTEDVQHQPLSFFKNDVEILYTYDANKHLARLTRNRGPQGERREFHYEDPNNSGLLTGITDSRGVRFATWSYDGQGRAITSQHSNGAGFVEVAYSSDGSRIVTNELGKKTVYRYQQIGGVNKVISIEGQPSANCPESDSTYTYNDRGQLLTKTDAKGYITTYTYNARGLETSRTEATGTALAKTTTTEWDPTRFLRTKVIEPTRMTLYTYDDQGRELSRQITGR